MRLVDSLGEQMPDYEAIKKKDLEDRTAHSSQGLAGDQSQLAHEQPPMLRFSVCLLCFVLWCWGASQGLTHYRQVLLPLSYIPRPWL
jgi:hypothetical protein